MSIKPQGGVFGRNPTFNNVDVDGTLTVAGNTVPDASTILVDGDIGSTVQGYDADTAKLDTAQTFTATQRIDANVGIRTDPSFLIGEGLHLKGSGYANLTIQKGTSGTGHALDFVDDTGALEFRIGTNFSSGGNNLLFANASGLALKVDTSSDVTVTSGNVIIGTSGKGIDFSATAGTGTSELFDDYEEGVFTPVLVGTTTAGTGTYTKQYGFYTKIGNLCFIQVSLEWSAHTGTGNMRVTGLPFSIATDAFSAPSVWITAITLSANSIPNFLISSSQIDLYQTVVGSTSNASIAMDTTGQFVASAFYRTA